MADRRDPRLVQEVNRLMNNARSLQGLFAEHYQYGDQYIGLLKTGFQNEGTSIKNSLATLNKPPLKPALNAPNSVYNQFISTWNNGAGDLTRSFNQISEFWRLLQAAEPELNLLMVPPGPGPAPTRRPPLTPPEIEVFRTLRTRTNDLLEVFRSCVVSHSSSAALQIKEHVRVIGEQINSSSLSQQARMALTKSNAEWQQFTSRYKNGTVIDRPTLTQLEYFVNFVNIACAQYLG